MILRRDFVQKLHDQRRLTHDFRAFAEAAWPMVEPRPFIGGWHIDAICHHLQALAEGKIKKLIINMPPRHGKSLLCAVLFGAWCWARDGSTKLLFCSYAQKLSNRDSKKFRALVLSDWFQSRWGHKVSFKGPHVEQGVETIKNSLMGHRIASSPGGRGTGLGGDIIGCDDPNKVKDASSDAKREDVNEWWVDEMPTRGNSKNARWLIVQQRVHARDLTGFVTCDLDGNELPESEHGYCVLRLPAEFDGDKSPNMLGFVDPREHIGDLLWPEGCDRERLEAIKDGFKRDPYKIAGQLQQRPIPKEGGEIELDWFNNRYTGKPDVDSYYISCDFSGGSTKKKASQNAFALFGVKGSHVYALDVLTFRGGWPLARSRFIAFCSKHPQARVKLVEDTVLGRALIQESQEASKGRGEYTAEERRALTGIIAVPVASKDKMERMRPHMPDMEAGYFHLPLDSGPSWVAGCVIELCGAPNAATDDVFDTISQFLTWLRKPKRRGARITGL